MLIRSGKISVTPCTKRCDVVNERKTMGRFLSWLKWFFCRMKPECEHLYRKYWSRLYGPYGGYVRRCVKCGEEIKR